MSDIEWPLKDWHEPDLDKGYIISRSKTGAEVTAISDRTMHKIFRAAERYAKAADRSGIAVTADEWVLAGKEAIDQALATRSTSK